MTIFYIILLIACLDSFKRK